MITEKSKCSAAMLTALLAAIKHGRRVRTNTESFIRSVELGWFANYQIDDLSYDLELEGFTDQLLADAGVTLAWFARERHRWVPTALYTSDLSRRYEATPREAVRR